MSDCCSCPEPECPAPSPTSLKVGETGVHFLFSTGLDMSGFTAIGITFTKPDGSTLVIANPSDANLTVGSIDVQTIFGTFTTNRYLDYIFQAGDLDQSGDWSARAYYTDAYQHLISDSAVFTVNP